MNLDRIMCVSHEWLDEKPCPYCAPATEHEEFQADIGKYRFIGKPRDSECFYGYHAPRCPGCNCTCHGFTTLYPPDKDATIDILRAEILALQKQISTLLHAITAKS